MNCYDDRVVSLGNMVDNLDLSQGRDRESELFSKNTWKWTGTNIVCRNWHMSFSDPSIGRREQKFKITLRHSLSNGRWILIVNCELRSQGSEPISSRKFCIDFQLCNDKMAKIDVDGGNSMTYLHTLTVDNTEYPELREVPDIMDREFAMPSSIMITDSRIDSEIDKNVVLYQVSSRNSRNEESLVERRFSEFVRLDTVLRASLSSHLQSSLPVLPSKMIAPWTNQTSESFVNARRIALETYLVQLSGFEKVVSPISCTYIS